MILVVRLSSSPIIQEMVNYYNRSDCSRHGGIIDNASIIPPSPGDHIVNYGMYPRKSC
jgi:hypothetical protein